MPYGDPVPPAGINDLMTAMGQANQIIGTCPYCSGPFGAVYHTSACPRVAAIEYHPNGTVKRVEFRQP